MNDAAQKASDENLEDVCGCHFDDDIPCAPCFYDPSYLLRKTCTLFHDNFAKNMIHRHSRLLSEYMRVSAEGILLRDLRYFMYALEFLCRGLETEKEYGDILRSMLELCCRPPLMLQPIEGLSPMDEVEEMFNSLGYLVASLDDLELQLCAVQAVHCLLTRHAYTHENCVSLRVCQAAMERSTLTTVVGQFLEFAPADLYTTLVDLALLLSSLSIKCSRDLALAGAIDFILLRLNPEYPFEAASDLRDPCETSCLDEVEKSLLWGMLRALQVMDEDPTTRRTPSSQALRCLSYCLHNAVQDGYVPGAISLMSLVLLALHLFPHLPVVESGLADDLTTLTVCSELNIKEKWTETINSDRTREAFELKRLLLLSLSYLAQHKQATEILRKKKVIVGLLRLAEPHCIEKSSWHPKLSTALADLALHALTSISVTHPHDVVQSGGLSYFLLLIESFISAEPDIEKLLSCFTALYHISSVGSQNDFLQEVIDAGAIGIILRFCNHIIRHSTLTFAQQRVLTMGFLVLEILCKKNEAEKKRHGKMTIKIFSSFLKLVLPHSTTKDLLPIDDRLTICVIDFVWKSIIMCPDNCERIVKEGYVYKLLDLLQISIFPVQLPLLGLLVDLIEFGNGIAHVLTWRGSDKCAFLPLLMNIWRHEELYISPHRDTFGCIAEVNLPLMGREQWFHTYAVKKDYETSPAITDMYASARPKIYAIVKLINQRYKDLSQEIENFYHIHNHLRKEDEITMRLADNFLEMKMKEVWTEIALDLTNMTVIPIDSDSCMMNILNSKLLHRACEVHEQQYYLVQDIQQKELTDENNLYQLLEGSNAIEQNETLKELEMVTCATDHSFMNAIKQIEQEQINTNFPEGVPLSHCFRSYSIDPLCKLILHQLFNVRCRKDLDPAYVQ